MGFEALNGYTPQKVKDGFDVIKENNMVAEVTKCQIEEYTGDKEELKGTEFLRYELTIIKSYDNVGRKLWKRFNLSNDDQLKKLADTFFTVGLEFNDQASLEAACEKFAAMQVVVRAWGWKPDDGGEERQMHMIKGLATEETAEGSGEKVPF